MNRILFILIALVISCNSFAQPSKTIAKIKPYKWQFGLAWSLIDDDGRNLSHHFNISETWNLKPYPVTAIVNRYFDFGLSAEASVSVMQYSNSKVINGTKNSGGIFLNTDVLAKYNFQYLYMPKLQWLDPFINLGLGYTYRNNVNTVPHVLSLNVGGGINFWIAAGFGITMNTQLKWGAVPEFIKTNGNYIQHNLGIVFRMGELSSNSNSSFGKKKYGWSHKSKKFKQKKGH